MNRKKLVTRYLLALAVLIALSGIWQPATAKSKVYRLQAGKTIGLGRQGLHANNIPRGVSQVYLNTVGTSLPARFSHRHDLKFRAPVLEVRFLNDKGGMVESIDALIYVYFNIGRAERAQWAKSGMQEIAIWYASEQTGGWERCPTFFISDPGRDGTAGRLACLAPGSGTYALEREVIEKGPRPVSPAPTPIPTEPYPYPPPWATPTPTPYPYPAW